MMDTRIIELAIEALEEKRKAISAEIAELTAQITGGSQAPKASSAVRKGRRTRSAAERRAHSERMKAIWAERKAKAAKPKAKAAKAAKPGRSKPGQSTAANKARSEKMRAYWAQRKAQKTK